MSIDIPIPTEIQKITAVKIGSHPKKYPKAIPPKAAWDIPAPIKESLFKTTKTPSVAPKTPTMSPINKALCMKVNRKISNSSPLGRCFPHYNVGDSTMVKECCFPAIHFFQHSFSYYLFRAVMFYQPFGLGRQYYRHIELPLPHHEKQ